jgi:hypothetical protein
MAANHVREIFMRRQKNVKKKIMLLSNYQKGEFFIELLHQFFSRVN